MKELKRYRILVVLDEQVIKMGRYYGKCKSVAAKKAFKYLSRKLECNTLQFEMQEVASGKLFSFIGNRAERLPPLVK